MKKVILEKLLVKYERSKHFKGEGLVLRRVSLNTKDYPGYQNNDLDFHKSFQQAAAELASKGIVEIEWVKYEKDNLIKAVHLVLDRAGDAYRLIGKKPKLDVLAELENRLVRFNFTASWANAFIGDCLEEIGQKFRYPSQLPSEPEKLQLVLDTLVGLETKGAEEMLERIFSKRYLGNSKAFEQQVSRRLAGILRRYRNDPDLEEEALLAEVGLVRAASEILLSGPIQLRLRGEILELRPFHFGLGLGNETLSEAEVVQTGWRRVLSVENKATFRELLRKGLDNNTLLICLGGFPGPIKRKFMNKIYQADKEAEYYHWADLDYGGLQIFNHLSKCWPDLQPLRMDLATYETFLELGEEFDDEYGSKLQSLLNREEFACFHQLISAMLRNRRILEQEAVTIE